MKKFILLFILWNFSISLSIIEDAVYIITLDNNNYSLALNNQEIKIFKCSKYDENTLFRIKSNKIKNNYYDIEFVKSNEKLSIKSSNLILTKKEEQNESSIWNIILADDNRFIIQNINNCFIINNSGSNIKCESISKEKASKFNLIKVYEEISYTEKDLELIEKEPIDVFIKYIDLSDKELIREGINQIKKDEDNGELKYCIRSILKNIPWIRKIFIILPNKKVRYFKDYDLIKEKIIYVNDKDLIGFDSANSHTFQFNYWKMEKFGASKNFISMDDDYFIGKPLNKSDFFYVENNKVIPKIIATNFREETKENIEAKMKYYKKEALSQNGRQTTENFLYLEYNTLSFIFDILKKPLIVPDFTHTAIPFNTEYLKEIYYLIYNSDHKKMTLESTYRTLETLQFQNFYMTYIFNKYNIKVGGIPHIYIDIDDSFNYDYNIPLFVINTGGYDYKEISFDKAKLAMEKIFPEPTPYEKINYSEIINLSINVIKKIEKENESKNNQLLLINLTIISIVEFFVVSVLSFYICRKKIGNINKSIKDSLNIENSNSEYDSLELIKIK